MLRIIVPGVEQYDPVQNLFYTTKETTLTLEHSLVSISKWESKWKRPFMSTQKGFTRTELQDYVRCMTLTQNVDPLVYNALTQENYDQILKYMEDPMTATTVNDKALPKKGPMGGKTVTSELVYYWMTALNIPFECQKWHFNRLMTLIRVASIEQQPPKKMSKRDIMSQNKSLNAARKARLHSHG